jgi:phosphoribosylformylglycinamidine synthase subunit PurQ / glutaminase
MEEIRSIVLTGYGINCQEETAHALLRCGSPAQIVHIDDLIGGRLELASFHLLVIPGGFSYGDHLGSGRALASRICHASLKSGKRLIDEVRTFVAGGGHILGICNGFQVLVKSGLLPALGEGQQVTLTGNKSGKFENRWVRLVLNGQAAGGAFASVERLYLPVRHGEGRFIGPAPILEEVRRRNLVVMYYADDGGGATQEYPENPNGSMMAIAGICDLSGRVIGIMPHPEAFIYFENHPYWTRVAREEQGKGEPVPTEGEGLLFFRALLQKIRNESACTIAR